MTANCDKKCKVDRDESSKSVNGYTILDESALKKEEEKNAKVDDKPIYIGHNSVEVFVEDLPSGSNENSNQSKVKTTSEGFSQKAACKERRLDDGKDVKQETLTSFTKLHVAHLMEVEEEEPTGYNRFYFESDHLALKDNKHYHLLLQTLLVLEAQRSQAIKDLDVLCKQQANALKDPVGFVEKLQDNEPLGLPSRQRVVKLPSIPWEEYSASLGPLDQQKFSNPHHTRAAVHNLGKAAANGDIFPTAVPTGQQTSDGSTTASFSSENNVYSVFGGDFVASKLGKPLDRESLTTTVLGLRGELGDGKLAKGRLSHENKPVTFNQPWTAEEQAKLEKLLQIYPQEEVESKRWEKIAAALGNRTLKQVASRVQKYFIKLARAGLPVPGRMPNVPRPSTRSKRSYQHYQTIGFRNSTFFPSYRPRVLMDDEDDVSSVATDDTAGYLSDEESVPADLRDTDEYKELMELKRIKRQKIMEYQQRNEYPPHHNGFMCDGCGVTPIRGTRWHCRDCTQDNSTDFCSDCFERGNINIGQHTAEHSLDPVTRNASFFIDGDYIGLGGGSTSAGYNYLDPNFLPAAS